MSRTSFEKRDRTKGLHLTVADGGFIDFFCPNGESLRIHFQGKNGYNMYQVSCVGDRDKFKILTDRSYAEEIEVDVSIDDEDSNGLNPGKNFKHKGINYTIIAWKMIKAYGYSADYKLLLGRNQR